MVGKICPNPFGGGEEVAMFGGVAEGCDGAGLTIFPCICFEVGVK
jgi:hypothetical protein